MQAVIIAGGKGTRLKDFYQDIPKGLIKINNKTVLEYQIDLLKKYKIKDIILLTGYMSEKIENYFGNGKNFGVHISYFKETNPLGTAGCLKILEKILEDDALILNSDLIINLNIDKLERYHKKNNSIATIFLHPNNHPYDSDIVLLNNERKVTDIKTKPHETYNFYNNLVSAGVYLFNKKAFKYITENKKQDMCKDFLPQLIFNNENIFGYISTEYVKDMGTPERLEQVTLDIKSGKVEMCGKDKRPAIFLDRDGVINKEIDLLYKIEDFELLPDVAEAIKRINNSGYLCVVVTNQPVVARNLINIEKLQEIHTKMEWILGQKHCFVDAIYFCPHHPDKGYPEENKDYKIKCFCRKPNPGMIFEAAKDLNIDLKKSFIIGDRETDILAGKNAGVSSILVKINGENWESETLKYQPNYKTTTLVEAVDYIFNKNLNLKSIKA